MLFFALAALGIAAQLVGLALFVGFALRTRPDVGRLREFPGVTVLKPCYQIEDEEAVNYDTFFHQDYPGPLQLLFVASRETDPAVPLVREFLKAYPQVDAQLVFSASRNSYWGKIDAFYDGHQHARHDHLIISDSDVRVGVSYVKEMVAALQEPGVSLVSTPQFDRGANTIGSGLKLGNNCDTAVVVTGAYLLSRVKRFSLGHSIGFRLSEFRTLGEDRWDIINTFLAEDMAYAFLFTRAGKRAVLRNIYCPVSFANKTIGQTHRQKVRWLLNQKMVAPNRFAYLGGLLLYPEIAAALSLDWQLFLAACLSRIAVSLVSEALYQRTVAATLRYFWLIPIWDLAQVYYFAVGFFKETIRYGEREYRVVNRSYLEEIRPGARPGAPV
jgi:ceramide glucosyltransferase